MGRSRHEVNQGVLVVARGPRSDDEAGFTLVELVVAMTMLALTLLSLSYGMYSGMNTLQVARHKTSFLELANAEVENIRAQPYDKAGVNNNDAALATAYPSNLFEGRDAVIFNPALSGVASAVSVVTTQVTPGLIVPYTIRRWVTWTDAAGGTDHKFKRVDVRVEWTERGRAQEVRYSSLYYPGNLGPPTAAPATIPVASFIVCPGSTCSGTPATPALGRATVTQFAVNSAATTPTTGLTYAWNWGDCAGNPGGCTSTGASPSPHTYLTSGAYSISLTATTTTGTPPGANTVTRDVLVGNPRPNGPPDDASHNRPPVAAFTTNWVAVPTPPATNNAPLTVTANGTSTTDPDADPIIYTWDWGDLTAMGSGSAPSHTYTSTGTFTITLTAADPGGRSSQATTTIIVGTINCSISSVASDNYFQNPTGNATKNRIALQSNGKPVQTSFFMQVRTNTGCTGVTLSIPQNSGSFVSTLGPPTTSGTVKTWTLTTSVGSSVKFNSGTTQSAIITATSANPSQTKVLTFSAS